MIVEFVRVSEQGFNWTPVWQTAIGTFGGFFFGLVAFGIQRWFVRRSEEADKDTVVNDALKRLLSCASTNTETLASLKLQFFLDLEPEVKAMKEHVEKAYQDDRNIKALADVSEKLLHFYKTMPRAYEVEAPTYSELSRVADEMPGLSTFIHRAMSSIDEYNSIAEERNRLIAEHAKESAAGMNGHRVRYYSGMLVDQSAGMIVKADDAMAFFLLVSEQVESYFDYGVNLEGFNRFRLVPKAMKVLPEKDRFPEMRKLLVDFHVTRLRKNLH